MRTFMQVECQGMFSQFFFLTGAGNPMSSSQCLWYIHACPDRPTLLGLHVLPACKERERISKKVKSFEIGKKNPCVGGL